MKYLIVGSGSADNTFQIAKDFPIRKIINASENDFNYSYALNLGIKESWGRYIGIISGHSLPISRTWYQDAMENFSDPKMAAVTGHYTALPDGSLDEKLGDLCFDLKRLEKEFYCKWMTNTNAIIRKDLWGEYSLKYVRILSKTLTFREFRSDLRALARARAAARSDCFGL